MPEFKSTLSLLARKFFSVSSLPGAVKCLIGFKLNGLGFFFFLYSKPSGSEGISEL